MNRRAHSLACQVKPKPGLLVESLEGEMISPYWPPICSLPVYSLPSTVYKSPRVLNGMRLCEFSDISEQCIYLLNISVLANGHPCPKQCVLIFKSIVLSAVNPIATSTRWCNISRVWYVQFITKIYWRFNFTHQPTTYIIIGQFDYCTSNVIESMT